MQRRPVKAIANMCQTVRTLGNKNSSHELSAKSQKSDITSSLESAGIWLSFAMRLHWGDYACMTADELHRVLIVCRHFIMFTTGYEKKIGKWAFRQVTVN